jgi:hypothetical protein
LDDQRAFWSHVLASHCEEFIAAARQDYIFATDLSLEHFAIQKIVNRDPLLKSGL